MTESEVDAALLRIVADAGEEGITEDDALSIFRWIEGARTDAALVSLWAKGILRINWLGGQPWFELKGKAND